MSNTYEKLDNLILAYKECVEEKKKRMLHLKIVEEAMILVKKIAGTISMQSGVSNEDLVQVGSLGLIKAIESYKPNQNTKFRTYATYFIIINSRFFILFYIVTIIPNNTFRFIS